MAAQNHPLRSGDPRQMGPYRIVGRLGQGGMGTVYLATGPGGAQVALKVIRSDLAHDAEFRRRFRAEVDSARQVPPFCTAEVLDADPDHEPPYLVVEFVDGPSLAAMVEERGPLSAANLHGLAIGVATALTAIHGAGVIHRDLKPTNVLLAPGSPKVIDFGIARAAHGATGGTRQDQLIGTIGYMAPERFGEAGEAVLTPAADIFAWGAVVGYAGTGHTPHRADSPQAMAVRVLTQPPDLDGLAPDLRELVAQALTKDPAQRPTARDLLDGLLTVGPRRSAAVAAALARQPALLHAAEGAQAATAAHPVDQPGVAVGRPVATVAQPGHGVPSWATTRSPAPAKARPTRKDDVWPPRGWPDAGRRWRRFAVVALAAVLLVAGGVYGVASGVIPLPGRLGFAPGADGTPTKRPKASVPPGAKRVVSDPLTSARAWSVRADRPHRATCGFDGALVVTKRSAGSYRCPGPTDSLGDVTVFVTVKLLTPGSCAGIWFRFDNAGYAVRVCPDGYYLVIHGAGEAGAVRPMQVFRFDKRIAPKAETRVGLSARGGEIVLFRDDEYVGEWQDGTFRAGRVVLGIFPLGATAPPPYQVSFTRVEVWS